MIQTWAIRVNAAATLAKPQKAEVERMRQEAQRGARTHTVSIHPEFLIRKTGCYHTCGYQAR